MDDNPYQSPHAISIPQVMWWEDRKDSFFTHIATWQVRSESGVHTVTLAHAYWSGKASIVVDGEVVYYRTRKWVDFGLRKKLVVGGVICWIRVVFTPWLIRVSSELLIQGTKQPKV